MDAERFTCVLEQYPTSLPNRRLMYIDRLLREMPHKTRTEIVSYLCIPYVTGCSRLSASFVSSRWRLEMRPVMS